MKEAIIAVVGLGIVALLAVTVHQNYRRFHRPLLTTPYQAVTLNNGSVWYGKIDHLGTDHPVLRDALTVQTKIDANTGKTHYVLLRRKDDINGADHMIFPATSIAFVEPVHSESVIGKLITRFGN